MEIQSFLTIDALRVALGRNDQLPFSETQLDAIVGQGLKMVRMLANAGLPSIRDATVLEVGTGWQPTLPVLLSLLGARKVITFDHVVHMRPELARQVVLRIFENIPTICETLEIPEEELRTKQDNIRLDGGLTEILTSLRIEYMAPSDASRTSLPDCSLDLFFSSAVLEHIPKKTIVALNREAFRTLKHGGFYYNYVNLHDHYAVFDQNITRVNFLKYPEFFWKLVAKNKVSYLNRLRKSHYLTMFEANGFEISAVDAHVDGVSLEALKQMKLARPFRNLEPEDLATDLVDILCQKPGQPASRQ